MTVLILAGEDKIHTDGVAIIIETFHFIPVYVGVALIGGRVMDRSVRLQRQFGEIFRIFMDRSNQNQAAILNRLARIEERQARILNLLGGSDELERK